MTSMTEELSNLTERGKSSASVTAYSTQTDNNQHNLS